MLYQIDIGESSQYSAAAKIIYLKMGYRTLKYQSASFIKDKLPLDVEEHQMDEGQVSITTLTAHQAK